MSNPLKISRVWAMPSRFTFNIDPIQKLIKKYIRKDQYWIDPFANNSCFNAYCRATNDLNSEYRTTHHLDAVAFLKAFKNEEVEGILFDPPYSLRQLDECYASIGRAITQHESNFFWQDVKSEIARILKPNGIVISCGWNSGGIGKTLGFEIREILLVPHGGSHNDTIVTVERKVQSTLGGGR